MIRCNKIPVMFILVFQFRSVAMDVYEIAVISKFDKTTCERLVNSTKFILKNKPNSVNGESVAPFLSSLKYSCFHIENDLTDSVLFRIGQNLRKKKETLSGVIGPEYSSGIMLFHPNAILLDVPHIAPLASDPELINLDRFPNLIRMSHSYIMEIKAMLDTIERLNWNSIGVLCGQSLYFQHVRKDLTMEASTRKILVRFSRVVKTTPSAAFNAITSLRRKGQRVNIILGDKELATLLLKKAQDHFMMDENWAWLLSEETLFDKWDTTKVPGVLVFKRVVTKGSLYDDFAGEYTKLQPGSDPNMSELIYAESMLLSAYLSMASKGSSTFLPTLVNRYGITVKNISIDFGNQQLIQNISYLIWSFDGTWNKLGYWKASYSNISFAKLSLNPKDFAGKSLVKSFWPDLKYSTLKVLSMEVKSFVNIKAVTNKLINGSVISNKYEYSGYCIELLNKLSKTLGFKYEIVKASDQKYGTRDPISGQWNGLLGELIYGDVDLVLAPITVTSLRASAVDLTNPFMETSLKFVFNRVALVGDGVHNRFSFLMPFDVSMWYALVTSVFGVMVYLTLVSRLSPYGAHGKFFQSKVAEDLSIKQELRRRKSSVIGWADSGSNQITLEKSSLMRKSSIFRRISVVDDSKIANTKILQKSLTDFDVSVPASNEEDTAIKERQKAERCMSVSNALYFACAGLLWQSPENVPKAPSARIVAGIWYMVGVIIVCSYTANLITFISRKSTTLHLTKASDFASQDVVSIGTLADSSVDTLLKSSQLPLSERLYEKLLSNPKTGLQESVSSALDLVEKGKLAFLWESMEIDNIVAESNCALNTVELGFGNTAYALALKQDSSFTDSFNREIIKLQRRGFLDNIKKKHFHSHKECKNQNDLSEEYNRLPYASLAGVFDMLSIAGAVSLIILITEWFVASFFEVDRSNLRRPSDFTNALRLRIRRLKEDFVENWLPLKDIRSHWSKYRSSKVEPLRGTPVSAVHPGQWKRFKSSARVYDLKASISNTDC